MEKINVAEILRNCPQGMELYSPLCGDCKLYDVNDYNIKIKIPNKDSLIILRRDGTYCANGEIMIFPKGKTTWEGFVPPFKDGDILVTGLGSIFILKEPNEKEYYYSCYIALNDASQIIKSYTQFCTKKGCRLATEEEKQKLFQAIKDNGYKWNEETKTLVKLIKPKFKVGDRIQSKNYIEQRTIKKCEDDGYWTTINSWIKISNQDNWELVPNKFDINTLVPFESRVLVRDNNTEKWKSNFWGFYDIDSAMYYPYECGGSTFAQCIPYKGNEHLLGKTDDCSEFYKTWK